MVLKVPQSFKNIQTALNAAVSGDTILMAPGTYKERLLAGDPVQSSEILGESEREEERIMLGIRLPEGIAKATLTGEQINRLESYLSDGYLGSVEWSNGRVSLTRTGRLIADRIVRELLI